MAQNPPQWRHFFKYKKLAEDERRPGFVLQTVDSPTECPEVNGGPLDRAKKSGNIEKTLRIRIPIRRYYVFFRCKTRIYKTGVPTSFQVKRCRLQGTVFIPMEAAIGAWHFQNCAEIGGDTDASCDVARCRPPVGTELINHKQCELGQAENSLFTI